jgi:hypothetical protein
MRGARSESQKIETNRSGAIERETQLRQVRSERTLDPQLRGNEGGIRRAPQRKEGVREAGCQAGSLQHGFQSRKK